jgi:hypothetical protein
MQHVSKLQSPQAQVSTESIAAYAVETYEKRIPTNDQKQPTIFRTTSRSLNYHSLQTPIPPSASPKMSAATPSGIYTCGELYSLTSTTAAMNCANNPTTLTTILEIWRVLGSTRKNSEINDVQWNCKSSNPECDPSSWEMRDHVVKVMESENSWN